jgi:hypothetical protein
MSHSYLNCYAVQQLLEAIRVDHGLPVGFASKYLGGTSGVPPPPPSGHAPGKKKREVKPKEGSVRCTGKTAKGEPCKFAVREGGLCGIHLRQQNKPEGSSAPKPKVVRKVPEVPKHTHALTEESEECGLCSTQGNVMVPALTKADFEAVSENNQTLQERLAAILANSDEDTEDEGEVEPEEVKESEDIRSKLRALVAEEDDVEEDEVDLDQCETPPSKARLAGLMQKLTVDDEPVMDMDTFEAEMGV